MRVGKILNRAGTYTEIRGLPADRAQRLYEAFSNVAGAVPLLGRRALIAVWRRHAWRLPDTEWHQTARGGLVRTLPDLVRPDWDWIIKVLPDDGAAQVLTAWMIDAGYANATST